MTGPICNVSCSKNAPKGATLKAWWKLDLVGPNDELIEIDHIDFHPQPFIVSDKDGYVYWIDKKRHVTGPFQQAELSVMSLCNDPDCDDPECKAYQKELKRNELKT